MISPNPSLNSHGNSNSSQGKNKRLRLDLLEDSDPSFATFGANQSDLVKIEELDSDDNSFDEVSPVKRDHPLDREMQKWYHSKSKTQLILKLKIRNKAQTLANYRGLNETIDDVWVKVTS